MFDYEDDPVFQFMLYEFVTEDDSESTEINLEIKITVHPEDKSEVSQSRNKRN